MPVHGRGSLEQALPANQSCSSSRFCSLKRTSFIESDSVFRVGSAPWGGFCPSSQLRLSKPAPLLELVVSVEAGSTLRVNCVLKPASLFEPAPFIKTCAVCFWPAQSIFGACFEKSWKKYLHIIAGAGIISELPDARAKGKATGC